MSKPLTVISAGRTRDLAGWQPAHLADVISGRAPARRGPRSKAVLIDLDEVGAVVLWTKQPAALLDSPELVLLLEKLKERRILAVLQLSVTGLGGSPLEPGIPGPLEAADTLQQILEQGLLAGPDCVKLRWDPVAEYELGRISSGTHQGKRLVLSNASADLFVPVFERFRELGATTWTSSVLDLKYRGAAGRLKEAGFAVLDGPPEQYRPFYAVMEHRISMVGGKFSICCSPEIEPWVSVDGCIDGEWINGLRQKYFGPDAQPVETMLHNEKYRGGQRPRCGCSYSLDISYSTGFRTCATQYEEGGTGGCCLYCYSWHGKLAPNTARAVKAAGEELLDKPPLHGPVEGGAIWYAGLTIRDEVDDR